MVVLAFWVVSLSIRDWHQFLSASVAQTSFPVQLGGLPQVAAPLAYPATGLVLSPDCRPIPAKLVERSLFGQFVEMQDFLMNNVKLVD